MSNVKRRRIVWSVGSDPDILEKFRAYSVKSRIPATRLLDEAMEDFLVKYKVIDKKDKKCP